MRLTVFLFTSIFAAGCAVQPIAAKRPLPPEPVVAATLPPTKVVETRYELRGYRDAANPSLRHEPHSVYRRARVSLTTADGFTGVSRDSYPPVSLAPLPASEELAAELATQKKLTNELRAMQAALADAERMMKAQYATLVQQSAETIKLREQLETERNRLRVAPMSETAEVVSATATPTSTEVKW